MRLILAGLVLMAAGAVLAAGMVAAFRPGAVEAPFVGGARTQPAPTPSLPNVGHPDGCP